MALSKPSDVSLSAMLKKANTERKNTALGAIARMNIDFTHPVAPRVATDSTVAGPVGSNKLSMSSLHVCVPVVKGDGAAEYALRMLLLQRTYARSTNESIETETAVGILMVHLSISGGVDFSNKDVQAFLLRSSIQVETVDIESNDLALVGEFVMGAASLEIWQKEIEECNTKISELDRKEKRRETRF